MLPGGSQAVAMEYGTIEAPVSDFPSAGANYDEICSSRLHACCCRAFLPTRARLHLVGPPPCLSSSPTDCHLRDIFFADADSWQQQVEAGSCFVCRGEIAPCD